MEPTQEKLDIDQQLRKTTSTKQCTIDLKDSTYRLIDPSRCWDDKQLRETDFAQQLVHLLNFISPLSTRAPKHAV